MAAGKYWDQPWCPGSGSHKFSRNYQELDGKNRCRMLISCLKQMLSFPFWWCHREWPIASLPMLTMFDTCRYSKCQGLPKIHLHSKLWKVCNHSFFPILCSVLHSWSIYLLTYNIYIYDYICMYMYMYIIYCNIIVTLGSCHIAKLHLNHVSHLSMKHRPAAEPTLQYPEMCVCVCANWALFPSPFCNI